MGTFKIDTKTIIIVILAILLLIGSAYHFKVVGNHDTKLTQEKNLRNALSDTLKIYQNKEKEWVAEKLTIQTETKVLKDKNLVLSENQKELIRRVDAISKDNQIITAALIKLGTKIEGLENKNGIVLNDSTVKFIEKNDSIDYDLRIHNVKQYSHIKPVLEFKHFNLPNEQFISFQWKDKNKKEGYPVSFSISNSNSFYQIHDIDSYIIPEIQKELIKPTWYQKLGKFSKTTTGKILFFGVGFVVGAVLIQ